MDSLPEAADALERLRQENAHLKARLETWQFIAEGWRDLFNDMEEARAELPELRDKLDACHESARKWHRGAVQGYRLAKAVERAAQSKYGLWFGNVKARKLYDLIDRYRRGAL